MRALALPADRLAPRAEDGRIVPGRRVVHRDGRRLFVTDDGLLPVPVQSPTTRLSPASMRRVVTTTETV